MPQDFSALRINSDRMLDSFTQVSAFGSTADGGVNRPSFSEAHLQARKWFREQIEKSGFEFRTDGAGNHQGSEKNFPLLRTPEWPVWIERYLPGHTCETRQERYRRNHRAEA